MEESGKEREFFCNFKLLESQVSICLIDLTIVLFIYIVCYQ